MYTFMTWSIMAHHNLLSVIAFSHVYPFPKLRCDIHSQSYWSAVFPVIFTFGIFSEIFNSPSPPSSSPRPTNFTYVCVLFDSIFHEIPSLLTRYVHNSHYLSVEPNSCCINFFPISARRVSNIYCHIRGLVLCNGWVLFSLFLTIFKIHFA